MKEMKTYDENKAIVRGIVTKEPRMFNEKHGMKMSVFEVDIPRESGASDTIPIIVKEDVPDIRIGYGYLIEGTIRSKMIDGRTFTYIQADSITDPIDYQYDLNKVKVTGTIHTKPYFKTVRHMKICTFVVDVRGTYGRHYLIPVVTWGYMATYIRHCDIGDEIRITGRIQCREHSVNGLDERVTSVELSAKKAKVYSRGVNTDERSEDQIDSVN